ncbi:hypothetical protein G6O67_005107 [Ophiocordyceps sinensis]|uniref:tRNA (adenine(58)-N(1))-methyltransferase catalytic subunit TRM61 n=1 Tax=Ophiocordyceps sinensis TaxID=72228 RepID=A0A8H4PQW7_9HYPO|nr:hypothetical protein G6O67_005107 [Ophiocordyceps sinensis]
MIRWSNSNPLGLAAAARGLRFLSSSRTIKEHDVVLLRQHGSKYPRWHLSSPLRPDALVKLSYGASVPAADIIGRNALDVVLDSRGHEVVLHEPSLASYVVNQSGERSATPIYPHDANTIVSLLDLHPCRPGEDEAEHEADHGPPLEMFEAGTGMGSLTLHLARAIHAANPPVPSSLRLAFCRAAMVSDRFACDVRLSPEHQAARDTYAASRRVILHTLDNKLKHLNAAFKLVRDFRRALYLPSIDFHTGSIDGYLSERLAQSGGQPFLYRAILDLPGAHENVELVAQALHPNALLVVFQPSISQIADFEARNRQTNLLRLEKVLELPVTTITNGLHDSVGGRQWDVRMTFPRAQQEGSDKMVQVLRPKVGDRIGGGGFVAVYRRWPVGETPAASVADEGEKEVGSSEAEPTPVASVADEGEKEVGSSEAEPTPTASVADEGEKEVGSSEAEPTPAASVADEGKKEETTQCSPPAGVDGNDGAVVVDLKHLQHFSMDTRTWTATIGAGTRLGDVTRKLHEAGGRAMSYGTS